MMRDWKAIAKASGCIVTGSELARITDPLETLEETFRRLSQDLSPDLEPSISFRIELGIE
jgi:hypothetical protein